MIRYRTPITASELCSRHRYKPHVLGNDSSGLEEGGIDTRCTHHYLRDARLPNATFWTSLELPKRLSGFHEVFRDHRTAANMKWRYRSILLSKKSSCRTSHRELASKDLRRKSRFLKESMAMHVDVLLNCADVNHCQLRHILSVGERKTVLVCKKTCR